MNKTHSKHHIETGWSPSSSNAIRATCRDCGDYAEAYCANTDYFCIRSAEVGATGYLGETCCIEKCRAQRQHAAA